MTEKLNKKSGRIDDIEALRAIAVLFTLISHVGTLLTWGSPVVLAVGHLFAFWSGVDLFLCISGFVIARELFPKLTNLTDRTAFWRASIAFWIKRIYRIWPTSLLWAFIILITSIALRKTGILPPVNDVFKEIVSISLQMENIHAWRCSVQPGDASCTAAGPWWSLSLEEQFYTALPIIIFFFRKKTVIFIGLTFVAVVLIPRPFSGLLWHLRTDSIALGVLLAIFSTHSLYSEIEPTFLRKRIYSIPLLMALLALLAGLSALPDKPFSVIPFSLGMISVVSAVIVLIASYNRDYVARGRATKWILLWIGSRSFAIYITHWPSIWFTRAFWRYVSPTGTVFDGTYTFRFIVMWIALTIIFSELNYRFVERPLRAKGRVLAEKIEHGITAT